MDYHQELKFAIAAVKQAARLAIDVQSELAPQDALSKQDRSPVTVADYGVQALISHALRDAYPNDPLMGEESSEELHSNEAQPIIQKVIERVTTIEPNIDTSEVVPLIDRASHAGGNNVRFWTLDPIDGTKGFLRRQQYAIALALIENGQVVAGVLGCPNLPASSDAKESGCILAASKGAGAQIMPLGSNALCAIHTRKIDSATDAIVCESVETAHSDHSSSAQVSQRLGISSDPVRIDSQCKYAVVARGDADIYLRLPTRPGYEERIWDHAAGAIIVTEAGGVVTDVRGEPLDFSQGSTLCNNTGVIATSGSIHGDVVAAVGTVLK
ncbi:MAG: 3'(2'),5'-bisphosphate nucleotidase [Phycisphaerae bacterium]|nr:MAG: 3'(2'),5'-bisphosphate nucleotidase [Phycisphaerae bacterium]